MLAAAPPACRQGVTPLAAGAARGVKPAARVGAGRREGALAASRNLSSLHAPLAGTALQGERQDAAERRRSGTGGGRRAFLCRAAQAGGRPAFNKGPLKLPSYFGLNPQYKEDWRVALPADIVAGISVACVVIPQSLAYSTLAGVPLESGLLAASVAPIPASLLASSRYLQTGPVALTCFLTAGCLSALNAVPGTAAYATLAATLAVVVGVIRFLLGVSRIGSLITRIPRKVLDGFTLAAATLILATQIPAITGHSFVPMDLPLPVAALYQLMTPWSWSLSAPVAACTVLIINVSKRIHRLIPGALIATALGCLAASAGLPVGETIGAINYGEFALRPPSFGSVERLLFPGLMIAVAGFSEAAAIGRRFAEEDGERWDASQELMAQGAANVAAGLFGGLPVGGSFTRSSLNRVLGARSRLAGAVTGVAVILFLTVGANVLAFLPKAVLGGLVVGAVIPLLKPVKSRVAWMTFAVTMFVSPRLELGLLAGLIISTLISTLNALAQAGLSEERYPAVPASRRRQLRPKGKPFF